MLPVGTHCAPQNLLCIPERHESVPHKSVHSKRRIERFKQSCVAEWLEQAFDRTLCDEPWTNRRISTGGDENDWNRQLPAHQFPLKIRPGHPRHGDVEDQAPGLADAIGREELFRRRERTGCKAKLRQQVGQRFADRLVVIDYGHE